jgi:CDP-paratose 2-epimerase
MNSVLVTGSSGLIGSEVVEFFDRLGCRVLGIDNNMRRSFFGDDGDTTWNLRRLQQTTERFIHHELDVRDRARMLEFVREHRPQLIVHCAAQPSHDLAAKRPFDDFDVNAGATLNLLEAARRYCPESPFVFMSTNKVYGDAPNEIALVELESRWDYAQPTEYDGIDESCRVDATLHSLFGASKLAADVMVQEYGRYFNMPTVCFRGGCLTGPKHSGAELHGFLAYIARAVQEERSYRVFGYKGKQVRDNIHSYDVCTAIFEFYKAPRPAAVYNLGGGRANSISVLEAIHAFEQALDKKLSFEILEQNRLGDHICYISNLSRFKADYPNWSITKSLGTIIQEVAQQMSALSCSPRG